MNARERRCQRLWWRGVLVVGAVHPQAVYVPKDPSLRAHARRGAPQSFFSSPEAHRREITLQRHEYEALHQARRLQASDEWKDRYKIRAGGEGTIPQGVQACSLRRSRHRRLGKTSLQHQLTGAAINLACINAWLDGDL